ncbi:uncharacterized protein [Parasteatoda tepidariorum]|uniref:uncharacterized protein isoform X1 n=1 Tax=Parasteatoda tepidariorum TaxID=114398 RepID=UPI00077FCFC8|nr:uncharacterized protein LOC107446488 [Parasteatoda tepidariorum]
MLTICKLISIFVTVAYVKAFDLGFLKSAFNQAMGSAMGPFLDCVILQYCDCEVLEEERICWDKVPQNVINFARDTVTAQCDLEGEPELPLCEEGNVTSCLLPYMCPYKQIFKSHLMAIFEPLVQYNYDLSKSTDPIKIADNDKLEEFKICFTPFVSYCMMFPTYCKSEMG